MVSTLQRCGRLTCRSGLHLRQRNSRTVGATQSRRQAALTSAAPTEAPQRGVLILPGLANNAADYRDLAKSLEQQGMAAQVLDVGRLDWGRNASALTDINWWRSSLKPRPVVDWYLNRVVTGLDELKRRVDGAPITLLTHSAGGWLGRVFLLEFDRTGIDQFVSLGSPHLPPPKGIIDQTRGILTWCSDACPGAFHPEIHYLTVAGKYVQGKPATDFANATWKELAAGAGYQQVCGDAEVWGDFIVPVASAHLPGATNIDLEGAFHSPLGAQLPTFGPWYGQDPYLEQWLPLLLGQAVQLSPAVDIPAVAEDVPLPLA